MTKKKQLLTEFVAFSDHHAHNFQYKSKRKTHHALPGIYNSRLLASAAVLEEIAEYCTAHNIETVLFGGDLFHQKTVVHTDIFNVTMHTLVESFKDMQIYAIPGNHDYADRAGNIHSLVGLKRDNIHVCDAVQAVDINDSTVILTVPYTDHMDKAKTDLATAARLADYSEKPVKILLAHLGMQGAVVGSDYVLIKDSDIQVDDVAMDSFSLCLFGHFHQHQQLFKNGYYIGASHQHNWGDSDTARGFVHVRCYTDRTYSIEQIETTSAPKFLMLNSESTVIPSKNDFVKYKLTKKESPSAVKAKFDVEIETIEYSEPKEPLGFSRDQLNPENMIKAWVDAQGLEDPEEIDKLVELGRTMLAKATNDSL